MKKTKLFRKGNRTHCKKRGLRGGRDEVDPRKGTKGGNKSRLKFSSWEQKELRSETTKKYQQDSGCYWSYPCIGFQLPRVHT